MECSWLEVRLQDVRLAVPPQEEEGQAEMESTPDSVIPDSSEYFCLM